jgi:arylsulfatase A-like enzyme
MTRPHPAGTSTRGRVLVAIAVAATLLGAAGNGARDATSGTAAAAAARPNIVLIVTDDQRADQLAHMPAVQGLAANGLRFTNAYVSNSLCCPSRATILTGRYSHSTGVYTNDPDLATGGWRAFRSSEGSTVATWLRGAGYRTALVGKYLNGYPNGAGAVTPPGWHRWFTFANQPGYVNYTIADNGVFRRFGATAADYSTDVLAGRAAAFIRGTPDATPLFLAFTPFAPHVPHTPAARHAGTVPIGSAWRPPNFDEADVSDKPAWVASLPSADGAVLDRDRAMQAESLRAVDDAVRKIVDALRATGRLANTLIIYTSDNGMQSGSHRYTPKQTAYRESIHVPLIVRYDPLTRQRAGETSNRLVVNIDHAPSIADAAGVAAPRADGRSFVPLLTNPALAWRSDFLIEHEEGNSPVPSFCGLATFRYKLVEYATGERELYDQSIDPFELHNRAADAEYAGVEATLHARLLQLCTPPPPGLTLSP